MAHDRNRSRYAGAALPETAIFLSTLLVLLLVLLRFGVHVMIVYNLVAAARQGAAVAATAPLILPDDNRVRAAVQPLLALPWMYSSVEISNTRPTPVTVVSDASGAECSREVTVRVRVTITLPFPAILGSRTYTAERNTSMRYAHQPLCS